MRRRCCARGIGRVGPMCGCSHLERRAVLKFLALCFVGYLLGVVIVHKSKDIPVAITAFYRCFNQRHCLYNCAEKSVHNDAYLQHGQYGSVEGSSQHLLVVGVMTSRKYLATRADAVYSTWGKQVPGRIVFYVGQSKPALKARETNCYDDSPSPEPIQIENGLPVVELRGVNDSGYPPRIKCYAMLQHMFYSFRGQYQWFFRSDDDLYIRLEELVKFLHSVDRSVPRYIGQAANGLRFERKQLGLKKKYCMGGPGIVFSPPTLAKMVPHLQECACKPASKHEDTELGRCVDKYINIPCTYSRKKGAGAFRHGYSFSKPDQLQQLMSRVLTLHPAKDAKSMKKLHYVAQRQSLYNLRDRRDKLLHELWKISVAMGEAKTANVTLDSTGNGSEAKSFLVSGSEDTMLLDENPIWNIQNASKADDPKVAGPLSVFNMESQGKAVEQLMQFVRSKRMSDLTASGTRSLYQTFTLTRGLQCFVTLSNKTRSRSFLISSPYTPIRWQDTDREWINLNEQGESPKKANRTAVDQHPTSTTRSSWPDLHILLPLFGRYYDYPLFLGNLTTAAGAYSATVHLHVALYAEPKLTHAPSSIADLQTYHLTVSVRRTRGKVSEARLAALTEWLPGNAVVILMDVDMIFTAHFLRRVASNVGPRRAYLPVAFARYPPEMACYRSLSDCSLDPLEVRQGVGEWATDGFSAVGITMADLKETDGCHKDVAGWGGPKADFVAKCLTHGVGVMQAPDLGLVRLYRKQECVYGSVSTLTLMAWEILDEKTRNGSSESGGR